MDDVKLSQKGYCLNHSCDLQHWHLFTCIGCASLEAINNLLAKYKEKVQHPLVLRPVAVRAHTNALTKGCERHKSAHEPFVVSLTPTTNHFLHPTPPFSGCFPQPQTLQFISDTVRTNYKLFLCLGFRRAALVGAPHAVSGDEGLMRAKLLSETDFAHNNAALRAVIDHMVALSWTFCQH